MKEGDLITRLVRAHRCLVRGRAAEAAHLLESVSRIETHPYVFFLSACSFLENDSIGLALPLINKLRVHWPDFLPGKELDAFVKFKSASSREEAAVAYLECDPGGIEGIFFGRIISRIRNSSDFFELQRKARLPDYVKIKKHPPRLYFKNNSSLDEDDRFDSVVSRKRKIGVMPFIIVLILGILGIGTYFTVNYFVSRQKETTQVTPDLPSNGLPLVGEGGTFEYRDDEALRRDYSSSRELMKRGEYNKAVVLLNRILQSNAQPMVKDRAEFLMNYISGIEDRHAEEFDPSLLSANPDTYRNCMVVVHGKLEKIEHDPRAFSMQCKSDISGNTINAEVFSNRGISFSAGKEVQVTGVFKNVIGHKGDIYIEAIDVR